MQQRQLGDCSFLAAIMSAQQTDPGQLAENIAARGSPPGADGWEVELFIDGQWESITVSPEEITNDGAMQVRGDTRGDGEPGFMSVYERRSEEHTSELQSRGHLVCRLLLEKKN